MRSALSRWAHEALMQAHDAQGLVEYALLVVLISIACVTILSALGSNISVLYSAANVMTSP
jgi:Flp pilus assembly pilin Flp